MNEIKIGSIFCMSWGYDQTNVNYFQVTRLTPKGVYVREIGCKGVEGTAGFMCQDVKPVKNNFLSTSMWCDNLRSEDGTVIHSNTETFHRINSSKESGKPYFTVKGRYYAFLTTENSTTYSSWYA